MGGLMTNLWKHTLPALNACCGHGKFSLLTDRRKGIFLLVLGHRVVSLFNVVVLETGATITLDEKGSKELPPWLNAQILLAIAATTLADPNWR